MRLKTGNRRIKASVRKMNDIVRKLNRIGENPLCQEEVFELRRAYMSAVVCYLDTCRVQQAGHDIMSPDHGAVGGVPND